MKKVVLVCFCLGLVGCAMMDKPSEKVESPQVFKNVDGHWSFENESQVKKRKKKSDWVKVEEALQQQRNQLPNSEYH